MNIGYYLLDKLIYCNNNLINNHYEISSQLFKSK